MLSVAHTPEAVGHLARAMEHLVDEHGHYRRKQSRLGGIEQGFTHHVVDMREIALYIRIVYTSRMGKSEKAKIFRNGGSQAVRLPKRFRFPEDQDEVVVRKVGRRVIIEPVDEWNEEFLATLGAWSEAIERPASEPVADAKDPFA